MIFPVIAFFAPGGGELIVVMLALLLLFGPKDAPRILRSIQNVLNKLQRAAADFRYKLMYEDLHRKQTEESKDTAVYDVEEKSAEDRHAEESPEVPPGPPPADETKT
ncbi:MAG: twin-arginine translocase TatA/TatE family subunit [Kiritimatiellales bacterium]|jgi:Sec-independent protein translocase protein TatA